MTCKEFTSLTISYLSGDLPEEKQEAFELHYFECDSCFARLKVEERLYSREVPIAAAAKKPVFEWLLMWKWKPLLAAAAILVVVLSSTFVIQHTNHMKLMYNISTFSPPVYMKSEIRGEEAGDDTFAEAMQHYNQGNYTQALAMLKRFTSSLDNPQVVFFKGICFLLVDELKHAVKELDIILEGMNASYYDEAIYYKAIALLRMNKKAEALEQLNHLAGMFSPYAPKAKDLIQKISNI